MQFLEHKFEFCNFEFVRLVVAKIHQVIHSYLNVESIDMLGDNFLEKSLE